MHSREEAPGFGRGRVPQAGGCGGTMAKLPPAPGCAAAGDGASHFSERNGPILVPFLQKSELDQNFSIWCLWARQSRSCCGP